MPSKVFDYIAREQARQDATVELIASENFVSENVLRAVGSCLTNKYAEGYPAERVSGMKEFLVQALQNTLKYTRISSARIAAWLVSLQIPTATRRQIAAAVGGDVLQQYLSLAREPVAGSNLRLGTVRRTETK